MFPIPGDNLPIYQRDDIMTNLERVLVAKAKEYFIANCVDAITGCLFKDEIIELTDSEDDRDVKYFDALDALSDFVHTITIHTVEFMVDSSFTNEDNILSFLNDNPSVIADLYNQDELTDVTFLYIKSIGKASVSALFDYIAHLSAIQFYSKNKRNS